MIPITQQSSLRRVADLRILVPAIAVFAVALGLPLAATFVLSFSSMDPGGSLHLWSLDGYRQLLAGGRIEECVGILYRAGVVSLATMLIATPTAYRLACIKRVRIQLLLLAVLITPWLVSDMLRAFGWQLLLSPAGPVSWLWSLLTGHGPSGGLRYNFAATVVGLVSSLLPVGVISVFAAIPNRSRSEWLAAHELGGRLYVMATMVLGRAKGGIVVGTCGVFVLACFASAEPLFLDGPTQSSVRSITASLANAGVPSLLAFGSVSILFGVCACVAAAASYRVLTRGKRHWQPLDGSQLVTLQGRPSDVRRMASDQIRNILDVGARVVPGLFAIVTIMLCVAPLIAVMVEAFWQPTATGGRWTLGNFILIGSSEQLVSAFANSFYVAILVACAAASIGFALSLVAWHGTFKRAVIIMAVAAAVLPGDVYSISVIQVLRLIGPTRGGATLVVVAHTLWALPFVIGALWLANKRIGEHVIEAAFEYASGLRDVVGRLLPRINATPLLSSAILAGTLSLNEYTRSSYLSGGMLNISNEVHGRLTAGLLPANRGIFAAEFIIICLAAATVASVVAVLKPERSLVGMPLQKDHVAPDVINSSMARPVWHPTA